MVDVVIDGTDHDSIDRVLEKAQQTQKHVV